MFAAVTKLIDFSMIFWFIIYDMDVIFFLPFVLWKKYVLL